MSKESNGQLHLPDLSIAGFRGIRELRIPRLGRVTLLAGKNGAGKTTVLEAVRVYAARGSGHVLSVLLGNREEYAAAIDDYNDKVPTLNQAALFYDRQFSPDSEIMIGPANLPEENLRITVVVPGKKQAEFSDTSEYDETEGNPVLAMKVSFSGIEKITWRLSDKPKTTGILGHLITRLEQHDLPHSLKCQAFGPSLLSNEEMTELWDGVALTDSEDRAVRALNLALDRTVDRVAMVGDVRDQSRGRHVIMKLRDRDTPVPLKSLGDGAIRLFGVALALAGSRNGMLLMDEVENGIHHSVHDDFWRMILRTAEENNVQVLATTHSFDCVRGFAKAAVESDTSEGVLVRLEREAERIRAVVYSEDELEAAAKHRIEVR